MRPPENLPLLLRSRGLSFHYYVGRTLRAPFAAQCLLITIMCIVPILIASVIDHSLTLPGRDIGLFEHPTIWAFLGLQTVLPLCLKISADKLVRTRLVHGEIIFAKQRRSSLLIGLVERFLQIKSRQSIALATLIYGAGLAAFVWNTYQNQKPGIVVPYDFWDSSNHFWGYWIGRLYKLYLFGWLLPYLALVQISIVAVLLRLVRRVRLAGKLVLLPFHEDGAGGLGFVAGLISTPVIVTLLVGSIPIAAAFDVHRALDVTPSLGVFMLLGWAVLAYAIPMLFLRSDIVALKQSTVQQLAKLEHTDYLQLLKGDSLNSERLRRGHEAIDYLDKIRLKVQGVPNYPHLKRLISYAGLALIPSILSIVLKVYEAVGPLITPVVKLP